MPSFSCVVRDDVQRGTRLDRYVAETLRLLSRSQIKARGLTAKVNGKSAKISRQLSAGDILDIEWSEPEPSELEPQDLPLDVLYEDEHVIVVNKAQGLVVHPGAGNPSSTLANALLFRRLSKGLVGEGFRSGIVHRLDKDTSGVIIAAYDDESLAYLSEQFKARTTRKTYAAIVKGCPREVRGRLENRIGRDPKDRKRFAPVQRGGKPAITLYRVVAQYDEYSLLLLRPKTGRTHQLRVHLKHLGCPILGDPIYSRKDPRFPDATLMLHALRLRIRLPGSAVPSVFSAPLPDRFRRILRSLRRRRLGFHSPSSSARKGSR